MSSIGSKWLRAALLAACVASSGTATADFTGRVVGVADGDTLTVMKHRRKVKIRISGIDAPERQQAFGKLAKLSLTELALGREVFVEEHKKDRYGRTLGRVMQGGADLGLRQIERGLAWHYKQYARDQPASESWRYAAAEKRARQHHAGLWREARPIPPWRWRHTR